MEYINKTIQVPAIDTKKVLEVQWHSTAKEVYLDGVLLLGAVLESWTQDSHGRPYQYPYSPPVYTPWYNPSVDTGLVIWLGTGTKLTLNGRHIKFVEVK